MDLVALGYSYTRIIHDYYVKNWKDERGSSKTTIARKAVAAYLADNELQRNIDPVFKEPVEDDMDAVTKQWAHQIDKFFSPSETVKLPYSFGDYLVMALDEDYRKQCLVELDRKRRTIVGQIDVGDTETSLPGFRPQDRLVTEGPFDPLPGLLDDAANQFG